MKRQIGPISEAEAKELSKEYVAFVKDTNGESYDDIDDICQKHFYHDSPEPIRKGQLVLSVRHRGTKSPEFIIAKVTSVRSDIIQAEDGPVVRITDGEYSWRVDGCDYCVPI